MATSNPSNSAESLKSALIQEARRWGFDAVRITPARISQATAQAFEAFIAGGYHGDMQWMSDTASRRRDPKALWYEARTAIMLGLNYGPEEEPLSLLQQTDRGVISVYARGRDYHDIFKRRLKGLARWLSERAGGEVKVFVDTAPLLEKPLAASAGLGWQGKHTNLVSREFGSWLFIGEILTTLDLPPDSSETDHCGTCQSCLDVCPTDAFLKSGQIDARRCVSYLTIEHKGHIDRTLRPLMGNRIYGCDDCLAVCPWNKFSTPASSDVLERRNDLDGPLLADLVGLNDAKFRTIFAKSPVKRLGRDRFVRNVLIAIANSGQKSLSGKVEGLLKDKSNLVRAMAVWALSRLRPERARALKDDALRIETDSDVRAEWALV